MLHSEIFTEVATALAKARGAFEAVRKKHKAEVKMRESGSYSYSYEKLSDVFDAIDEPLSANGLSILQTLAEAEDKRPMVRTTLLHASGQWLAGMVPLAVPLNAQPQAFGSAWTYARRYGLEGLLGIAGEDDDGKTAQSAPRPPTGPQRPPSGPTTQQPRSVQAAPVPKAEAAPQAVEREPGDDEDEAPAPTVGGDVLAHYRQRLANTKSAADVVALQQEFKSQGPAQATFDVFRAEALEVYKQLSGKAA